jgi:hypothetical protein
MSAELPATIELMARRFGRNYTIGYAWLTVTLGTAATTGLALTVWKGNEDPKRRIVFSVKEAIGFLSDIKVPPKYAGQVLAEAESKGHWK